MAACVRMLNKYYHDSFAYNMSFINNTDTYEEVAEFRGPVFGPGKIR